MSRERHVEETLRTEIGIVCGHCDTWNAIGVMRCHACNNDLSLLTPGRGAPSPLPRAPGAGAAVATSVKTASSRDARPPAQKSAPSKPSSPNKDFSALSQEELMEQARNFVCRSCSSVVPTGHKFCGRCGAAVPPEILSAQTLFFGDMQNPAKAKLILIRGEGMEGLSFHLKAEQHVVGAAASSCSRTICSCHRSTPTSSTETASSSCATRAR
jgi:hypothetical protein